jgi:transcriptional regulator with XRE-family HTH domain
MVGKSRNRLRVLRAEREISQDDLAIRAGVSRNRYWRIEKGYDPPTESERSKLAKALRVDESALGFPDQQAVAS